MTFTQELLLEKEVFEREKYHKKPYTPVVEYLREYKATGKYPYNAQVEEYIKSKEEVSEDMLDYLGTEVYLAQRFLADEAKAKRQHDMQDKGYIPASAWAGYVGPAELVGSQQIDWFNAKIATIGKIILAGNGEPFFVPKGKRSRGYYIRTLEEGFYKAITK